MDRIFLSDIRDAASGVRPGARADGRHRAVPQESPPPARQHDARPQSFGLGRTFRAHDAPLRQAGLRPSTRPRSAAKKSRSPRNMSGRARSASCCVSSGNFPVLRRSNPSCSLSRRCPAIMRRCCAARSKPFCPAMTSTSPTGPTRAPCRCPTGISISTTISIISTEIMTPSVQAERWRAAPYLGRVPGVGPADLRHRLDGGQGRSARAGIDGADGRPDRPARKSDGGQPPRARSAASAGSSSTASTPCPFPIRAWGARSIRAFCSLSGFMAMNIERHVSAHFEMFNHLVEGRRRSAPKSIATSTTNISR